MIAKNKSLSNDDFHELICGRKSLSQFSSAELYTFVERYPYFETVYKFYLKRLLQEEKETFQTALNRATSVIHMNDVFWDFLYIEECAEETPKNPIESVTVSRASETDEPSRESVVPKGTSDMHMESPGKEKAILEEEDSKKRDLEPFEPLAPRPAEITQENEKPDPKQFKRKIKEGYEHMGENLAATISSQMDLAKPKANENIQYSPDLYFIDENDTEGDPLTLADVKRLSSAQSAQQVNTNGFLEIDESGKVEKADAPEEQLKNNKKGDTGDLLDLDDPANSRNNRQRKTDAFDIREYADEKMEGQEEDLISRFIQLNPRLEPANLDKEKDDPEYVEELAQKSVSEDKALVSEPLIEVFIKQGYYHKAIDAFQQLSLNNPEKSAYFARRIKNLKEIIKKHKK